MAAPGDEYSTALPKGMKRGRGTECRGRVCAKGAPGWGSELQRQASSRLRQKGAEELMSRPQTSFLHPSHLPRGLPLVIPNREPEGVGGPQTWATQGPAPGHRAGGHRVDSVSGGVDKSYQHEIQRPNDHLLLG